MVELRCGKDLQTVGIQNKEGVNITAFLDHLTECGKCRRDEGALVEALNQMIGGEKE